VVVEIDLGREVVDAVEAGKQVELLGFAGRPTLAKVLINGLRLNLLLDGNGHGKDFERLAVLLVLALLKELRVER